MPEGLKRRRQRAGRVGDMGSGVVEVEVEEGEGANAIVVERVSIVACTSDNCFSYSASSCINCKIVETSISVSGKWTWERCHRCTCLLCRRVGQ